MFFFSVSHPALHFPLFVKDLTEFVSFYAWTRIYLYLPHMLVPSTFLKLHIFFQCNFNTHLSVIALWLAPKTLSGTEVCSLEHMQWVFSACHALYFCSVLFCFLCTLSISSHPICALPAPVILGPSLMCFTCISSPYSSSAPRIEAPVRLLLGARTGCENPAH